MRNFVLASLVVCFAIASEYALAQDRQAEWAKTAQLDADGNIYVSSGDGRLIKMAGAGHCIEATFAPDKQTVGCSVSRSSKPEEAMQSLRLEIYLKNGKMRTIETETPIKEWHFWKDGEQVAVYSNSSNGEGLHALYSAASGSLVEQLPAPSDESVLPQWAKGPAQVQDESVPVGEEYVRERTLWIAKVMRQIAKVQPGMKRQDLLKVLTTEGGLSNRLQRTYVYRECPYIKVNVRFQTSNEDRNGLEEDANDVIESISKPYLDWSVMD